MSRLPLNMASLSSERPPRPLTVASAPTSCISVSTSLYASRHHVFLPILRIREQRCARKCFFRPGAALMQTRTYQSRQGWLETTNERTVATPCEPYTMVSTNQNYKTDKKFEFYSNHGAASGKQPKRRPRFLYFFPLVDVNLPSLFEIWGKIAKESAKFNHPTMQIVYMFSRPRTKMLKNAQTGCPLLN